MKLITAIIRPEKVNDVLEALFNAEVHGLTISRAHGHGGETEAVETYRGTTVKMELVEKVRIDIGVSESFVERTISALAGAARTGEVGDEAAPHHQRLRQPFGLLGGSFATAGLICASC